MIENLAQHLGCDGGGTCRSEVIRVLDSGPIDQRLDSAIRLVSQGDRADFPDVTAFLAVVETAQDRIPLKSRNAEYQTFALGLRFFD